MRATSGNTLFHYWGKARFQKADTSSSLAPHPLPCHGLDVAAVAAALLQLDPALRLRVEALSPLPKGQTLSLLVFFAAIHDLGKLTLPFQWLVPELARAAGLPPWNRPTRGRGLRHTELGRFVWEPLREAVALACGLEDASLFAPLEEAAFGHHGEPVDDAMAAPPGCNRGLGAAAETFVGEAAGLFLHGGLAQFAPLALLPDQAPSLDEESLRPLSWLAAGLFVLADWVGSNADWFPPRPEARDLRAYWETACAQAHEALERASVLPAAPSPQAEFHALLPHLDPAHAPHPMQRAVLDLPAQDGPELLILEDVTGGGKTEAAILAAHRAMRAGRASGLFVGLPTMATANAMYARLAASYRALFEAPEASLILAHGGRAQHDGYLRTIALETPPGRTVGSEDAEAVCAAWLADNRKKALLAPCGAGTLDQALLAALPSRHQSLRLLGLSRSVLVADEVHAYDAYTGRLLEILLTFHAALGGSAVLLSATMPQALRAGLVSAWRRGRALAAQTTDRPPQPEPSAEPQADAFPLLTRITDRSLNEQAVAPARGLDVPVRYEHDEAALLQALAEAYRAGACACWVRNTVDDAVAARRRLVEEYGIPGDAVDLFHARFTGKDRKAVENRVLRRLGKNSGREERAGRIVLGTQVLEQSLDYDVDLMLSDLAPMELLIQRAGRCHRHLRGQGQSLRPKGYRTPLMLVLGPEPVENAGADWFAAMFPGGGCVYPRHGTLWLTARLLADKGRLRLPRDARLLVEGAYAGQPPEALQHVDDKALGESYAQLAQAQNAGLLFEDGYCRGGGMQWDRDFKTPTRLGEATQQVRLACCEEGGLRLWAARDAADASMRACLDSELRLSIRKLETPRIPEGWADAAQALQQAMPDQGRWSLLLPLLPDGAGGWTGEGVDEKGEEVTVAYGPEGLAFPRT